MLLSLIFTVLISIRVSSCEPYIIIGIKQFDPAGRETSWLYAGGTVEISCRLMGSHEKEVLRLQNTLQGEISFQSKPLVTVNSHRLHHNISINSTTHSRSYRCFISEDNWSAPIRIQYVLCNPLLIRPRRICPENGKFCHIKSDASAVCKRLEERPCLYGHRKETIEAVIEMAKKAGDEEYLQLPKLDVVCGSRERTDYGLCRSFVFSPSQTVRFVTTETARCDLDFRLYIRGNYSESKRRSTVMSGWDFVDVAEAFAMYVELKGKAKLNKVSCDIAYTKNGNITSKKIAFTAGNQAISEQLKLLPTPTIADIVCELTNSSATFLRYQTSLLVFRSDKDMRYGVAQRQRLNGGKKVYMYVVNVTAADGLFVCVEKDKGGCALTKGIRTPERTAEFKQEGDDSFTSFYIGLFASSPKRKFVLVHERTVNWTTHDVGTVKWTTQFESTVKWTTQDERIAKWTTQEERTVKWTTQDNGTANWTAEEEGTVDWTIKDEGTAKWTTLDEGTANWITQDERTVNWTIQYGRTANWTTQQPATGGSGWIIGVTVAVVIVTITVVVIIFVILWKRRKKGKQQQSPKPEKGASPVKALGKSRSKEVDPAPSSVSAAKAPYKEDVSTIYDTVASTLSNKDGERAYDSIYPKALH